MLIMHKIAKLFIIPVIFLSGCFIVRTSTPPLDDENNADISISVSEAVSGSTETKYTSKHDNPYADYCETAMRRHDIIHTKLELSFDIPAEMVFGKARIDIRPYFYASDSVVLDARGFDIHRVALLEAPNVTEQLKYLYDGEQLTVYTPQYSRRDTFRLFIDYTANPSKLTGGGSWAIRQNKGLYFQDALSDDPQIWTQGQPNANSGWFPTIDQPNERMTQEIILTVDTAFETLSNGRRDAVLLNTDGTKTVRWIQDKPHAPYLAAVIVGRFDILKYYWRDMPVYVYVEEGQRAAAEPTFRKTAKMIEFFSRKLQYDFPWDKYSQVVVRNFISGAMENTGATVFSSYFLSNPNAKYPRPNHELIVAHELFHQWFGDLVTCESWANLTLNEAFASYAEYLWLEHEYGRFFADRHLESDRRRYFYESVYKNADLIRFFYKESGDMFDAHSYEKGAAILHSLRYEIGEEAFFESLSHYLKKHAYSAVEVHDLRLAFEEVTGRDLNYFFNAWFLNKGYMKLDIDYETKDSLDWTIQVKQVQKPSEAPLYKMHVPVDFYFRDSVMRKTVLLDEETENYHFRFNNRVKFVKFDAENSLLCKKNENRRYEDYLFILNRVNNYFDQNEAIKYLSRSINKEETARAFLHLLHSPYYAFRLEALKTIPLKKNTSYYSSFLKRIEAMAESDPDAEVKDEAIEILRRINAAH